jgi:hypothetical protein
MIKFRITLLITSLGLAVTSLGVSVLYSHRAFIFSRTFRHGQSYYDRKFISWHGSNSQGCIAKSTHFNNLYVSRP